MMTPRQRMATALNLGIPDRVPTFELEFQLAEELMGQALSHRKGPKGRFAQGAGAQNRGKRRIPLAGLRKTGARRDLHSILK